MEKRGAFIVLEGNNGLGKTTQARLLDRYLAARGIPHRLYCFPRYESFFGQLAAAFLRGEHGRVDETSPYFVALVFANDRLLVRDEIVSAVAAGEIVLADRWVSSNMAVQAAKFQDDGLREAFNGWVQEMEYGMFRQPQPDLTIYLRARPETSLQNLHRRDDQAHLKGKADIEEGSVRLVYASAAQYDRLAAALPNWAALDVERTEPDGETRLLSIDAVHAAMVELLVKRGLLPP